MFASLKTVSSCRGFFALAAALWISGLGTALTSLVVYAELERLGASTSAYTLTFVLGLFPGVMASAISGRIAGRVSLKKLIVGTQFLGLMILLVPLWGPAEHRILWLILSEACGSAISGWLAPLYQSYLRGTFADNEVAAASLCDSFLLALNFIFGQLLGTVLIGVVGSRTYLWLDWISYLIATVLIVLGGNAFPIIKAHSENDGFCWHRLTFAQRRIFLMTPLLSLVCAPAMSVVPAFGAILGAGHVGARLIPVSLLLLAARAFGQLLGPWAARSVQPIRLLDRPHLLWLGMVVYLAVYSLAYQIHNVALVAGGIILAHLASNVVFNAAAYGLLREFSLEEIAKIAARHYQCCVLSVTLAAVLAGWVAERAPISAIPFLGVPPLIAAYWTLCGRGCPHSLVSSGGIHAA